MIDESSEALSAPDDGERGRPLLSVVTPAFNEAENLPVLYERLRAALEGLEMDWEWIVIDDHSRDSTPDCVARMAQQDARVRGLRFSRNFGSHAAISCGLRHARGDCVVVMAADLQDPPGALGDLVEAWRAGSHVVWAVRETRPGESARRAAIARLWYAFLRRTSALRDMPASGADFFLVDRLVVDSLNDFPERNASLMALITWLGFRQAQVGYVREGRLHGKSGWTLRKQLKLVADTLTSFTYFPIRLMSYAGVVTALAGFGYAGFVFANSLRGYPPAGWGSMMIVILVLGGIQMTMLGVLGEYLWRALDEARARPPYVIESVLGRPRPGARLEPEKRPGR